MDDSEVTRILADNSDLFSAVNNVFLYGLRFLGWWLVRGLCWLVTTVESAVTTLLTHLDFFSSSDVGLQAEKSGLFKTFLPVFWALLIVGVIIFGFLLMTNRIKKKADIPINLILTVVVVLGMPTILGTLTTVVSGAYDAFMDNESIVYGIVRDNVTDHVYIDANGFSEKAIEQKNTLPDGEVPQVIIDPVELAKNKQMTNGKVYKNRLQYDSTGGVSLTKFVDKSMFGDMFSAYYYRYKIGWFTIFLSLLALLFALVFTAIKVAMLIFNIAYNGIFMMFVAPLDISSGQRTKAVLNEIINIFATLICIMYSFKLYTIAMTWAADTFTELAAVFAQIGFSLAMIKGPDIVQRVLGIHAGVGNEFQQAAGMMYMASSIGRAGAGMILGAGRVIGAAGKAVAGAGIAGAAAAGVAKSGISNAFGSRHSGNSAATPGNANPNHSGKNLPPKGGGTGSSGPDGPDAPMGQADFDMPTGNDDGGSVDGPASAGIHSAIETNGPGGSGAAGGGGFYGARNASRYRSDITSDDTIGSSIRKWTASTRPVGAVLEYGNKAKTAFNIGKNTVDRQWDSYRKQVPRIHAEPVPDKPAQDAWDIQPKDIETRGPDL